MELSLGMVHSFSSIVGVRQGSKYASEILWNNCAEFPWKTQVTRSLVKFQAVEIQL